jgi:Asp-tRNA(Asn)/Glu-tRNA(Gln) amidotransferase B subunit
MMQRMQSNNQSITANSLTKELPPKLKFIGVKINIPECSDFETQQFSKHVPAKTTTDKQAKRALERALSTTGPTSRAAHAFLSK